MAVTYNDQAIGGNFDPYYPPGSPLAVTIINVDFVDADENGEINNNGTDTVNGEIVTQVYNGDTVTLNGTTYSGTTFYTAAGGRYFTPNDNGVMEDGNVTASSGTPTSSEYPVGDFGPPCFTAGTLIMTPQGQRPVEQLNVGDLVMTRDNGLCPVRWIGQSSVAGTGQHAPVRFAPGTMGNERALSVSPQHRMLVAGWRAQLLFGEDEVLVPAISLVDGDKISRAPCERVTYVHLMFDDHQVIFSEGAPTESFLVGDHLCNDDTPMGREIFNLFPELRDRRNRARATRPILSGYEGRALVH